MTGINIQLPNIEADQSIEVEVKVNGEKKTYHYRIEIFSWEECKVEGDTELNRAECLKKMLDKREENWQLIHIGSANDENIPLMFKMMN